MKVSIHQPLFLPWPGYFDKMRSVDRFIILDTDKFNEGDFQNRNRIRFKAGWKWLTIPIARQYHDKPISEVMVQKGFLEDWIGYHLGLIDTYYNKTPFFKDFFPGIKAKYEWLSRAGGMPLTMFDYYFIEEYKYQLGIDSKILLASDIGVPPDLTGTEMLICLVERVGGDYYLSGINGADYLDVKKFEDKGITLAFQDYKPKPYNQANYKDFVPGMSIIDMLFNVGAEEARKIV